MTLKNKFKNLKSLKVQSMIVLIFLGMIPLILFTLILINTYKSRAVSQRVTELQARGSIICNLIVSSAFFSNEITNQVDSELSQISDIYEGRIIVTDSNLTIVRDTYELESGKTILLNDAISCLKDEQTKIVKQTDESVQIFMPVYNAEGSEVKGVVIMDFSLTTVNKMYDNIKLIAITLISLIGVIIILVAVLYANVIVKPMKEVADSIEQISNGEFNKNIELKGFIEEEKISDNFNQMLSGLQNLEDDRQEFVSNVSHELKTPITSMKVLAESLVGQSGLPEEFYQEYMQDINSELDRMTQIINDLLAIVRMDKNVDSVSVSDININEFIENILKQLRPIAEQRNIEIIFESVRPVTAQIDEVKMGMAVRNLIENAIKYNFDNGWVRVSLNADHKFFFIKVSDSGVGIPEELQEHIFERFYRVDKARSRETGGNGLGLAITRSAILLHRGSIMVHSVENQGTTFNVRIPLVYLEG